MNVVAETKVVAAPLATGVVLAAIVKERQRQDELHPLDAAGFEALERMAILVEEIGEVSRASIEGYRAMRATFATPRDTHEQRQARYAEYEAAANKRDASMREELVQVAATAVRWVECIDAGSNS